MNFNGPQMQAICHREGPCLVIAGPGSGKTMVLTRRVSELIKSGIPANEILVITFTKAAAIEMKERFERLSENVAPVTFGTFHSLFWGILQREAGYKNSDIIMGKDRDRILKEALDMAQISKEDTALRNSYITELSNIASTMTDLNTYIPKYVDTEPLKIFINAYDFLKKKYHVIDFDDMLRMSFELLSQKPQLLAKWQSRFSYFLVDEMQDMNDLQFKLIGMLSAKKNNLFCVGDDDQSIYGFRGANPKIMQDFMEEYPNAKKIILDYNYRNPRDILCAAGSLIERNETRFSKEIKGTVEGGRIQVSEHFSPAEEAQDILDRIGTLREQGTGYEEIAVLYRNHSDARYVVDKLADRGIPFYLKEKMPNIYCHFVITDIENYFQIALGNVTAARLLAVINRPNRFLHRQSVEKGPNKQGMLAFYRTNPSCYKRAEAFWADIDLICRMSPVAAINYIRKAMAYESFLVEEAIRHETDMAEYTEILDFITAVFRDCRTLSQAIDKLNLLKLKIDYENRNKKVDKTGKVGLYTLHSSKGLEFENVFIIGCNDGVIPSNKADNREEMEGERRLFYVGITRCKKNLYISYTNKKNRDKSRFLGEMNLENYSSSKPSSQISSKRFETASYS